MTMLGWGGPLLEPFSAGGGGGGSDDGVVNSISLTLDADSVLHARLGRSIGSAVTGTVALGALDDYRGDWAVGTYGVGAIVRDSDEFFICRVARTASDTDKPSADSAGWQPLGAGAGGEVTGATLTTDADDNLLLTLTRQGESDVTASIHLTSVSSYKGAWSDTRVYAVGEMVSFGGRFYLSKTAHSAAGDSSATPDTDTTDWQVVGGAHGDEPTSDTHVQSQSLDLDADTDTLTSTLTLTDSTDVTAHVDLSGISGEGTDLSLGDRTTSGVTIESSTGHDVIIPPASDTESGVLLAAEHTHLAGQLSLWAAGTYAQDAQTIYAAKIYVRLTAGADNASQSPDKNSAWRELAHIGGLTQDQVDARIRALTNALALIGATGQWPKGRLPADIVYTADLTSALAPYLTATQIQAAISHALVGYMQDAGDWDSSTTYIPGDVVRHGGATYLCTAAVTAGTQEPGVAAAWERYWDRLGYQNGPPNAFVGAAIDGATITFARESGENPVAVAVPALFRAVDLGEATFNLSIGSSQTLIDLVDGDGQPIIAPAAGFVVATITAPTLGSRGQVYWMLADDLRAARSATPLTGGWYTTAANHAIKLVVPPQSAASTSNRALIQHIGVTQDETDGGSVTPTPSITRYDVTGDAAPAPGSIAGDHYGYTVGIAQAAQVSAARIIGFAGGPTKARPGSFATLATLTQYSSATGTVTIPAGTTLATAGDQYTLRLEVFGEGQATTDQPVAYHDYEITARAPAAETLFLWTEGAETTVQSVDLSVDHVMQRAGTAIRTWTFSGMPADDTLHRIIWLVPTSLTQPRHWSSAGVIDITSSIEAAVAVTIGGVAYQGYRIDSHYAGSRSNGTTIVTT